MPKSRCAHRSTRTGDPYGPGRIGLPPTVDRYHGTGPHGTRGHDGGVPRSDRPGPSRSERGRDRPRWAFRTHPTPARGPPVVIDAVSGNEVSKGYWCRGSVDILGTLGLGPAQARQVLRIGARDLEPVADDDVMVDRLARQDQVQLWEIATLLAEVEVERAELDEATSRPMVIEDLERTHAELERAATRLEEVRHQTFLLATTLTLLAMIGASFVDPWVALPFLIGSCASAGVSGLRWQQLRYATRADNDMLEAWGIESHLDYQLAQVERLTNGSDRVRRLEVDQIRREALSAWTALTGGGVTLAWAVAHRDAINIRHAELDRPSGRADTPPDGSRDDTVRGPIETLRLRLVQLTVLFPHGMPVVFDEATVDLDDFQVVAALSMIHDAMRTHQVVIMTDDPRVIGWASQLALDRMATLVHLGGSGRGAARNVPGPPPTPPGTSTPPTLTSRGTRALV